MTLLDTACLYLPRYICEPCPYTLLFPTQESPNPGDRRAQFRGRLWEEGGKDQ